MRTNQANKRTAPWLIVLGLTAILLGSSPAFAADLQPQTITDEMRCGACGMYPHRFPKWHSQVIFTDGTMTAFDGCKCMFRFLLDMKQFAPERSGDQIAAVWVKDFKTGAWIDGKAAHYVTGSKEMGPMGKELIPFAARDAAEEFQKTNGGTIETYANIDMAAINSLMGGMHHMKREMPHSPMH
jgi:nitrous oxide reductase accessory protein NosL